MISAAEYFVHDPTPPCQVGGGRPPGQGESIPPRTHGPLVSRAISQRIPVTWLQSYPTDARFKCGESGFYTPPAAPNHTRAGIHTHSRKSRARLKFVCRNTQTPLISQFCLTYHEKKPDGRQVKKHLNAWLQNLRRRNISYLWVLEFQKRGVPHFHVFLSEAVSLELHESLAKSWNRITDETAEHLNVHLHRKNFISWEMKGGNYLSHKYLTKEAQKEVPEGFHFPGRFWGHSRGLVPAPETITEEEIQGLSEIRVNQETGEVLQDVPWLFLCRTLRRYHWAKLRRYGGKKWVLARSRTVPGGAAIIRQTVEYLKKRKGDG